MNPLGGMRIGQPTRLRFMLKGRLLEQDHVAEWRCSISIQINVHGKAHQLFNPVGEALHNEVSRGDEKAGVYVSAPRSKQLTQSSTKAHLQGGIGTGRQAGLLRHVDTRRAGISDTSASTSVSKTLCRARSITDQQQNRGH